MAKVLGVVIVLVVVALGVFLIANLGKSNSNVTGSVVAGNSDNFGSVNSNTDPTMKTFEIMSSHLKFYMGGVESPELKVKQGDKVKIVFTNEEGFHDWVLNEFNARTKQIAAGNSETIEFVAGQKGTFEYYCSVGQHRANGMKGTFIVE